MALVKNDIPIEARMHFLSRDPKYLEEKPYTLRYAPAAEDGISQTNIDRVEHHLVFHDMRDQHDLTYDRCGFAVAKLENNGMSYQDYADSEQIENKHAEEVLECVKKALGASSTELIDYVVRRRHASWPIATGDTYSYQQPASRAHIGGQKYIKQTLAVILLTCSRARSYVRWWCCHYSRSTW